MNDQANDILYRWLRQCKISQQAHYYSSTRDESRHRMLGVQTVVTAVMAGTLMVMPIRLEFFSLVAPMLSFMVAVLAALQTFMGFQQRSLKHRITAAEYGSITREIELFLVRKIDDDQSIIEFLKLIQSRIDHLSQDAPEISSIAYDRIRRNFKVDDFENYYKESDFDKIVRNDRSER